MKLDLYLEKHGELYSISPILDDKYDLYEIIKMSNEYKAELYNEMLTKIDYKLCILFNSLYSNPNNCAFYESFVIELLEITEHLNKCNVFIHYPKNMAQKDAMIISANSDGTNVMTYIQVDGEKITDEDYLKLTHNLRKYVLLDKKWVYAEPMMLKHHNKCRNISSFLLETRDIPYKRMIFKDISKLNHNFKFDNSRNIFKNHQVEAIEQIMNSFSFNRNILLADDMGLGKTATAIAIVSCIKSDKPSLVVVPKSVVGNWINEFKKFAPDVKCYPYKGSLIKDGCVYITTYGEILHDASICGRKYGIVVLDEAQQIKNHRTVASARLRMIYAENKLAMTGTPMENTIMDLWSIMDFVQPGVLGNYATFKEISNSGLELEKVIGCLKPYCIRRLKSEIDDLKLPEKTEHIVNVELSDMEKHMYNAVIDAYKKESDMFPTTTVLKYISKLKMICGNPKAVFETDTEPAKLAYVKEIIRNSGFKPFVIFTQFRNTSQMILETLNKLYGKCGIIIDGTLSAKERTEISNKFQKGEYPFIVLTLKAGNCGLTLTNSCNLIHYDRWWNPAVENQATDRVYRIGQTKDVNIYKLVCSNTIEERISSILNQKTRLFNSIVDIIKQNPDLLERKID